MRKSVRRTIATLAGSTVLAIAGSIGTAAPAAAGDRPTNVGFVQAWKKVYIHHNGSLTVTAGVRCVPGWVSSDLDMRVNQGGNSGTGVTTTDVPCDNQWHPIRFVISDTSAVMHDGPVTIISQFLVNNAESGDSAAGHDQRPGRILHGHPAAA
jgi:hypothetical protein